MNLKMEELQKLIKINLLGLLFQKHFYTGHCAMISTRHLKEEKLKLPVYMVSAEQSYLRFDVASIPTTLIVDKNGRIVVYKVGDQDWNNAKTMALLNKLLVQ